MIPALLTFDIFGTVLDWTRGLREVLAAAGRSATDDDIDRIIDWQGAREQEAPFRPYREIAAGSLVEVMGTDVKTASAIGGTLGTWPLFEDSAEGLGRLARLAPCIAMTNSDRVHRSQVERQLGFELFDWMCAEDLGCYKPSPAFWHETAKRLGVEFARDWWHVSAYADYDLEVARSLGLTCVFVRRRHSRAGPAHLSVPDLRALADRVQERPIPGRQAAARP